ncbi:MAG: hypothetical protein WB780_04130 [Candidatus Acidiferrales bacterium]
MPQPLLTLDGTVRHIRILHTILLFTLIVYPIVAEKIGPHQSRDISVIWLSILAVSLIVCGIAFYFQFKRVRPAAERLQVQPDDASALVRWRAGNIVSFVLVEAVMLYGFALRFLGGTLQQSLPFYVVAIALMLMWWPQRPSR